MHTRISKKRTAVLADRRRRIVHGKFATGDQLPTRGQMLQRYGVSTSTLHQALDILMRDGFVVSRGPLGTFVADRPPHLARYGLVFPSDTSGGEHNIWLPLWRALREEAMRINSEGKRNVSLYYNVTGHTDVEDHQRLLRDIAAQRLAGLIFVTLSKALLDSSLVEAENPPRVFLFSQPTPPSSRRIVGDIEQETSLVFDHFVSRGRRRIAVLDVAGADHFERAVKPAMEKRGL